MFSIGFGYCNNNPVMYSDYQGTRYVEMPLFEDGGYYGYIDDQGSAEVGSKRLGITTISHGGCGVIATYNALVTLGEYISFDDVLAYYNSGVGKLNFGGLAGIMPHVVADYFCNKGYNVIMTDDTDGIDIYSQTADACILWNLFPSTLDLFGLISVDIFGGHFVEYNRSSMGYTGHNTGGHFGTRSFHTPSDYAYEDSCFYAIGIFIYK